MSPKPTTPIRPLPAQAKAMQALKQRAKKVLAAQGGDLPEGFAPLVGDKVAGWFVCQEGNAIQGTLESVFEVRSRFAESGKKRVYKVRVTRDLGTRVTNDAGDSVAEVGDVVGIDEKGWLKALKNAVGAEVYIMCDGKAPPTSENPMGNWVFRVGVSKSFVDPVTGETR